MNEIYRSLSYMGSMSVSCMTLKDLVQEGAKIHHLTGERASLFGNALIFGAYLGSTIKNPQGAVSVAIKTDGGLTVSVSCDSEMHVRGCIEGEGALTGGTLTVILEDEGAKPYVGVCLIESEDFSQSCENYFLQSEQVDTQVHIGCAFEGDTCVSAYGVVASLLPNSEDMAAIEFYDDFNNVTDVAGEIEKGAMAFCEKYFKGEFMARVYPKYMCNCSREKISSILKGIGKDELISLCKEKGCVSVHCHYCDTDYDFFEDEILSMF